MTDKTLEALAIKLEQAVDQVKAQGSDLVTKTERAESVSANTKRDLDEAMIKMNEATAEIEAIKQAMAGARDTAQPVMHKSAGEQMAQKLGEFSVDERNAKMRLTVKAGEIMNSVGSKPLGGVTELGMRPIIDLPLTIRDLIPQISIQSDSVEYTRLKSFDNQAGMVAEGATKPQSTLEFETLPLSTRVVAHYMKLSRQVMSDNTWLQGVVDGRLRRGLAEKIDEQLLAGDGLGQNLSGLLTNATAFTPAPVASVTSANRFDVLRLAMLEAILAGYNPNAIVLNPVDAAQIALSKDTQGGYLISNPTGAGDVNTIWGLRTVSSNALTADNFLVGDFNQAELFNRWDATVEAAYTEDDFIKNMITILAETRLALGVYDKLAFIKGDFTTSLA